MKTPKEKAHEIVNRFKPLTEFDKMAFKERYIEASLICVDEILLAFEHDLINMASNYRSEVENYYGLVKLEIEEILNPTP